MPWLQPGGVLARCQPDLPPEPLNPRGIPPLLKLPPLKPRDIEAPPPIPPPPSRANAGAAIATAIPNAITSVAVPSRFFITSS